MMIPRLLILFILIPLVELVLLTVVAGRIKWPATILLVVLTGAWGWYLARSQGLSILAKIKSEMASGRVPTAELVDGLLVLIGGIVLLTPGLLTDLVGFSLMIPGFRAILRERLKAKFAAQIGNFKMHPFGGQTMRPEDEPSKENDDVIDV